MAGFEAPCDSLLRLAMPLSAALALVAGRDGMLRRRLSFPRSVEAEMAYFFPQIPLHGL